MSDTQLILKKTMKSDTLSHFVISAGLKESKLPLYTKILYAPFDQNKKG
jgi:hypothetical protein